MIPYLIRAARRDIARHVRTVLADIASIPSAVRTPAGGGLATSGALVAASVIVGSPLAAYWLAVSAVAAIIITTPLPPGGWTLKILVGGGLVAVAEISIWLS